MQLNAEQHKIISDYINALNLLPNDLEAVSNLFQSGNLEELLERLDFFAELEMRKEKELYNMQKQTIERDISTYAEEIARETLEYDKDISKVDTLSDIGHNVAISEYYDDIDAKIDADNQEIQGQIMKLKEKYMQLAEDKAISNVKDKLR